MTMVITGLGAVVPTADPDWFDVKTSLPGRGYKRLPVACQYLLAATRTAILDANDPFAGTEPIRRAVVVGTNNAGAGLLEEIDRTIIDSDAGELSPITAPFMAMSSFVSRLSTEYTVQGFNLTTNTPRTAGLDSIGIAARALRTKRADVFVVGATEDAPPLGQSGDGPDVGAAVLICESVEAAAQRGAAGYGTCRTRSFFVDPADPDISALPQGLSVTDAVLDRSPVGEAVRAWAGARHEHVVDIDSGCLAPVRVLLELLAAGGDRPMRRTLVTASAEGTVALAELEMSPRNHITEGS